MRKYLLFLLLGSFLLGSGCATTSKLAHNQNATTGDVLSDVDDAVEYLAPDPFTLFLLDFY